MAPLQKNAGKLFARARLDDIVRVLLGPQKSCLRVALSGPRKSVKCSKRRTNLDSALWRCASALNPRLAAESVFPSTDLMRLSFCATLHFLQGSTVSWFLRSGFMSVTIGSQTKNPAYLSASRVRKSKFARYLLAPPIRAWCFLEFRFVREA